MGQPPSSLIQLTREIIYYYIQDEKMSAWEAKRHVAKLVGITPQSLCRYLAGSRYPDSTIAPKIRKLGSSLDLIKEN